MKQLTFVVVLLAATGIGVAIHNGISGPTEGSFSSRRSTLSDNAPASIDRPATARQGPEEGASLPAVRGAAGDSRNPCRDEMSLARGVAESGDQLLAMARKDANDRRLLGLAAQHFRTALAHETPATSTDPLFGEIRKKLTEIDQLQKPVVKAPTPVAPKPVAESAPELLRAPKAEEPKSEPLLVGPDGVIYRRAE